MATWRNSRALSNNERWLLHEGLLEEITPGELVPADLAGVPALRAFQLGGIVPAGHVVVTFSACWIYTGWWPSGRMRQLYSAHPHRAKPPITYRHSVPPEFTRRVGGLTVTSPARTAIDLLLLEPLDEAMEGLFQLYGAHLTMNELLTQLSLESRRKRLPFVRDIIEQFTEYIAWRDEQFVNAVREEHARRESTPEGATGRFGWSQASGTPERDGSRP